jgi:hypothetical protein
VTSSAQDLLSFQTSLRPPRSLRILAAVAVGVVFTLATSPLSPVWILLVFAAAVILVSLWTAAQNRARGLRGNGHAPMRPDAETSVVLGGDVPLPRPWWRQWDLWLPLAYVIVCVVVSDTLGAADSPVISWIAAVTLGCLATAGLLWWWVGNDGSPSGYLPLSTLVRQAPQWRPAVTGRRSPPCSTRSTPTPGAGSCAGTPWTPLLRPCSISRRTPSPGPSANSADMVRSSSLSNATGTASGPNGSA